MSALEDARLRLDALAGLEEHAREGMRARFVGAFVQQPESHHFHDAIVEPVSPRRSWGWPDAPGTADSTGFSDGTV